MSADVSVRSRIKTIRVLDRNDRRRVGILEKLDAEGNVIQSKKLHLVRQGKKFNDQFGNPHEPEEFQR